MRLSVLLAIPALGLTMHAHAQEAKPAEPAAAPQATAARTPPPDIPALMAEVEKNQQMLDAAAADYTYHVHFESKERNGSGETRKTTVTDAESFTIDGVRVNRKTMVDEKPLTPDEAKKENDRIDKQVADAKANRSKLADKGKTANAQGQAILPVKRVLELGTFSNLRAGDFGGRPMWMLDYAGDPRAQTHDEFEKVVKDLVGTIWIDQQDHVLVAARGHFVRDFKIGFGLVADVHKDSWFSFSTTKVGNVWLRHEIEGDGAMRYLLFGGFNGHVHTVTSNYKRFRTNSTIRPNTQEVDENGKPIAPAVSPGAATP